MTFKILLDIVNASAAGTPLAIATTLASTLISNISSNYAQIELLDDIQDLAKGYTDCIINNNRNMFAAIKRNFGQIIDCNLGQTEYLKKLICEVNNQLDDSHRAILAKLEKNIEKIVQTELSHALGFPGSDITKGSDSPSHLLSARSQIAEFTGRTVEIEDLKSWCKSENALDIRLYTGPGGIGKTRLFMKLCSDMKTNGWETGFVVKDAMKEARFIELTKLLLPGKNYIIVFDYANEQIDSLVRFLNSLETQDFRNTRIRIVLISREGKDWLDDLKKEDGQAGIRLREVGSSSIIALEGFGTSEDRPRDELFENAISGYTRYFSENNLQIHNFERISLNDRFVTPLHICIAALALIEGFKIETTSTPFTLMEDLIHREKGVINREFCMKNKQAEHLHQAVAVVALMGGLSKDEAAKIFPKIPLMEGMPPNEINTISNKLHTLYGHGETYLSPMEPDEFAAAFVRSLGADEVGKLITALLTYAVESKQELGFFTNPLRVLNRIARYEYEYDGQKKETEFISLLSTKLVREPELLIDAIPVATTKPKPIVWVMDFALSKLLRDEKNPERHEAFLSDLLNAIPMHKTWLSDFAIRVARFLADQYRIPASSGDKNAQYMYALLLTKLGVLLSNIDRHSEAQTKLKEAVTYVQKLCEAEIGNQTYLKLHADILNNLGNQYSFDGNQRKARESTEEAIGCYRELVALNNENVKYRSSLADCLINLGRHHTHEKKHRKAIEATEEAVGILRDLVERNKQEACRERLADGFNNLGVLHILIDDPDQSEKEKILSFFNEAVKYYQELVTESKDRDAYLPGLLLYQYNKGKHLFNLGKLEEATKSIEEAIAVGKELMERTPVFTHNIPGSYAVLGAILEKQAEKGDVKLLEKALEAYLTGATLFYYNLLLSFKQYQALYSQLVDGVMRIQKVLGIGFPYKQEYLHLPLLFMKDLQKTATALLQNIENLKANPEDTEEKTVSIANGYGFLGFICTISATEEDTELLEKALAAFTEGAKTLFPLFEEEPEKHCYLLFDLLKNATVICSKLGIEPDGELAEMIKKNNEWADRQNEKLLKLN